MLISSQQCKSRLLRPRLDICEGNLPWEVVLGKSELTTDDIVRESFQEFFWIKLGLCRLDTR